MKQLPLGLVIMTILIFTQNSFAQLTPGPLHRVHESLEGLKNCTQCHTIGSKDFQAKCLDCHSILKQQLAQGIGLHANDGYQQCQLCHSEHHGKDFELVHWKNGMDSFDHQLTGYALIEKHLEPSCRDCHQSAKIPNISQIMAAGKDPNRSFLGLSQDCVSCHRDPHEETLGSDCLSCHDMTGWIPTAKFDHDRAAFKLLGAHQNLECESCHPPHESTDQGKRRIFKPLAHQQCTDCHQDTHKGTLSNDCLTCHDLNQWKPALLFNHDRTAFPLTGIHRQVACEQCHTPPSSPLSRTLKVRTFEIRNVDSCKDCHSDPHQNRFSDSCSSCHQTSSWQNIKHQAFNHDQTRFPLKGLHQNLACDDCHTPGESHAIASFDDCRDCHRDEHQGQFDHKELYRDCLTCHTELGFKPAQFTVQDHLQTSFPLQGGHLAQPCNACHVVQGLPHFNPPTTQFNLAAQACAECHNNPHGEKIPLFSGEQGCESCHNVSTWTQIAFDHSQTEFPIRDGHATLSCKTCHTQSNGSQGFYLDDLQESCASCHEDTHRGQFNNALGVTTCEACHANATWDPDLFNHNQDTSFSLVGAHAQTPCSSCHPREVTNEANFIRFKPLPSKCEDCHATSSKEGGPL